MFPKSRIDLAELHAETPDLDLAVGSARELDRTVGTIAAEVTRQVEAILGLAREGARDEALAGERLVGHVPAGEVRGADRDLADLAHPRKTSTLAEDEELDVVDAAPDGHLQRQGRALRLGRHPVPPHGLRRFRRPVEVHDLHGRRDPPQPAHLVSGQHVSAQECVAEPRQLAARRVFGQETRNRGREVRDRDPLARHPVSQSARLEDVVGIGNVQRGAESEGGEDVAQQRVVRQPRDHGETVLRAQAEGPYVPAQEVSQRPVAAPDPLHAPGGPGGEGDVGEIVGGGVAEAFVGARRRLREGRLELALKKPAGPIETRADRSTHGGEAGRLEPRARTGRVETGGEPRGGIRRIEDDEAGAGPHHSAEAPHEIGGAARPNGHHIAFGDPRCPKAAREPEAQALEGCVVERGAGRRDGDLRRLPCRVLAQAIHDRRPGRAAQHLERVREQGLGSGREEGDLAQALVGARGHLLEHVLDLGQQLLHARRLEKVGVVGQGQIPSRCRRLPGRGSNRTSRWPGRAPPGPRRPGRAARSVAWRLKSSEFTSTWKRGVRPGSRRGWRASTTRSKGTSALR